MSKKNAKKNADIEAVAEVASEETLNVAAVAEEETPTVVTADETADEPEPDASADVEITGDAKDPTEHHVRVKTASQVYDVVVHADSRQDAKYRVYLQLEQFGPDAVLPKFDVDKYLARKNASPKKGGKKKGDGKKARNVVVVDLDAPKPETAEPDVTDNTEAVETEA